MCITTKLSKQHIPYKNQIGIEYIGIKIKPRKIKYEKYEELYKKSNVYNVKYRVSIPVSQCQ